MVILDIRTYLGNFPVSLRDLIEISHKAAVTKFLNVSNEYDWLCKIRDEPDQMTLAFWIYLLKRFRAYYRCKKSRVCVIKYHECYALLY